MTVRLRAVLALALSLAMYGPLVQPAAADQGSATGANGVRISVTPRTISNVADEVIIDVSGTGFDTTANGGFGIYLSFGERPTGDRVRNPAYSDVTVAYDGGSGRGTKWIRPGTPSGANQAKLQADGSFSVALAVKAVFTAPNGVKHSFANETLGVYAYAAHGTEAQASGVSQAVFVPLVFKASATPKHTIKPTPKATPKPTAKPTPTVTPRPTPTPTPMPTPEPSSSPSDRPTSPSPSSVAEASGPLTSIPPTVAPSPDDNPGAGGAPAPSGSPSPTPAFPTAAPVSGAGVGPAIPLILGLAILVLVVARGVLRRRSGQRP